MANSTEVAERATQIPSREVLERVEQFTREPFPDDSEALKPGTARRRALDVALEEIAGGHDEPSVEWRQQYSLLLGLERLLWEEEPKLVDGTVLSAHQVDALSGTLTALVAEAERQNGNGSRLAQVEEVFTDEEEPDEDLEDEAEDEWVPEDSHNGAGELGEEEGQLPEQPEDPGAARRFWFEHATGAGKTVAALC